MAAIDLITKTNFVPTKLPTRVAPEKVNEIIQRLNSITDEDGELTVSVPTKLSVAPAVTAHAGGTKAAAFQLTEEVNIVTTCATALDSVLMPTADVGMRVVIANLGAATCAVYGKGTNTIDDIATANPLIVQPETMVTLYCYTTAKWQSDMESKQVYDKLYADTIAENTSATGVTIDSVLHKDGLIQTGAGTLGTPAVRVNAANTGLYEVSSVQTGYSQDGVLIFMTNSALESGTGAFQTDFVRGMTSWGTTPVGTVSFAEYGDGKDMTTVLTLTNFIVGALAGAAAALGVGNIVYAFPAGQHIELAYSLSSLVLTCAGTAVATDTGLGSVKASGPIATLDGTATFEDRLTGQTINTAAAGGAAVSALKTATAGIGAGIALNVAASVKNVFLNSAGTWNANNTGNLTATGTIVLKWTRM